MWGGWQQNEFVAQQFIPYWMLTLLLSIVGLTPWLPWSSLRFSLRTLLIATTLLAVVLGLTVYVTNN